MHMDTITAILTPKARRERTPGQQLAAWRALVGVSQIALAEQLETTQTEVSRIECGRLDPDAAMRAKIVELTGIKFPS